MDGARGPRPLQHHPVHIRRDNPTAAREVAKTIYDGCESLINSPHRGRKGKQAGTRELVINYLRTPPVLGHNGLG